MESLVVALFAIAALASVGGNEIKDVCNQLSKAVAELNKKKIVPTHDKATFNTGGLLFHESQSQKTCTDTTESFIETNPIPTVDAAHDAKLSQTTVKIRLAYKVRRSDHRYVLTARQIRGATCTVTATPAESIDLKDICDEGSRNWNTFMKPIEVALSTVYINNKVWKDETNEEMTYRRRD